VVPIGVDIKNPNFAKVAEAMGAKGVRIVADYLLPTSSAAGRTCFARITGKLASHEFPGHLGAEWGDST
jgi:hypothetical protein